MKNLLLFLLTLSAAATLAQTPAKKRPIAPADIYRLQTISDPQVSPEGNWVSYVQSGVDASKDKRNADIWMVSWDGNQTVQLTNSPDGESKPRFSPDGKYLSFISARQGTGATATKGQLWLMDRRGGEAKKLTDLKTDLEDYEWAPDGKKIALVLRDPDYSDSAKTKVRKPYVMDRYHFKADVQGYLEKSAVHLYVFDVTTKTLDTLTTGNYDEISPAWSPDGSQLAFVSNRTEDPDKNQNTDIYVIDARKGATMKQLTTWTGYDSEPTWSPDGKRIAYQRSTASGNFLMYDQPVLAVIGKDGGEPQLLSKGLDRPVRNPRWSKDGQSIAVLVSDDRETYVGQYALASGKFTKVAGEPGRTGAWKRQRPTTGWRRSANRNSPVNSTLSKTAPPADSPTSATRFWPRSSWPLSKGLPRRVRMEQPYRTCCFDPPMPPLTKNCPRSFLSTAGR